jgi:hypothetical protein
MSTYPVVDSGDNWWEQYPTFPTTPWQPTAPTFPDPTPSLPYTYPVYTDQPVKCVQCGTWWRGTEHRCNLNYGVGTTTNNFTIVPNGGESLRDLEARFDANKDVQAAIAKARTQPEQRVKRKRKRKKVDKKQPPDIVFK